MPGAMASRQEDWLRQAQRNLEHAARSAEMGHFEWACFAAQQAAEKAVKALFQAQGAEAWGHSVRDLLLGLPEAMAVRQDLVDAAAELDRHYIPPR